MSPVPLVLSSQPLPNKSLLETPLSQGPLSRQHPGHFILDLGLGVSLGLGCCLGLLCIQPANICKVNSLFSYKM